MADWCQLPTELLQLISEKLNSELYLIRFRSICSTWRFSIPKPRNHLPLNLCIICTLSKHTIFLIKPPTTPNHQTLYRPWLVRISATSSGKFSLWHPVLRHCLTPSDHPVLDFNKLSVFDIGQMYICTVLPSNPSRHRCVATFQGGQILDFVTHEYSGELVILRREDERWTKIPNVAIFCEDICIFKGRPCVTDKTGRTVMFGLDMSVHLVAEPVFGGNGDVVGNINIIVENESELLLVRKYEYYYDRGGGDDDVDVDDDDDDDEVQVSIDVFRLDQKEKKWLKLASLGDRVLFLGQHNSFVASAMDLGFDKGNFVIHCNYNDMSIFHLGQRQNSPLSDYPDYFKLFMPPPEWIA